MAASTKLSLIVPCYNEERGIQNLYHQLAPVLDKLEKEYSLEVIFVDDGSKDQTVALLQQFFSGKKYVQIVRHEVNKNLGAAVRTGFAHATGDIIITMDSDCTYDPQGIFPMLQLLDRGTSIVTASPYHPLGGIRNVPKYRLFLSKSITGIYRFLTGAKIYTFTALFRAQRKEVVQNILFKSNDFLATAEILVSALNQGHHVKEYPMVLSVREFGESKMKLLNVIWSHLKFATSLVPQRIKRGLKP
ncbi:glycosyltransferase family 2 protein [Candidatus Woesearchaeota archaeon]|nr:glycosyltransferase family 2 protein [Candidatus Woesearchaeota archaeon]